MIIHKSLILEGGVLERLLFGLNRTFFHEKKFSRNKRNSHLVNILSKHENCIVPFHSIP